jgi:2-methylcitrate dehydratase PrpD
MDTGKEMDTKIANELAKFVVETKYPDIQKEIVDFSKQLLLKTVAGMVAGSVHPSSRKMAAMIKNRKLPEEVGVIGSSFKTSLWEGVYLNAFFAHASELEDDSFGQGVSWDITVIPLLLPLAQCLRLSGKALTEALVVGLEIHSRTCLFPTEHLGLQLVPGAVGPAAAAARALGLGLEQTASALGLAMSGVAVATPNFGTDAHFFESALQSLQGIMAAEMAKNGLTGNPSLVTYLTGLLGKERVIPDKFIKNLGSQWAFQNIWIKKYPCCFLTHRAIDIVLGIRREKNLSYEDVEKIEVHISPVEEITNRPKLDKLGDLQFSVQHLLGSALLDGDVNFSHINADILHDSRYKEAMAKVDVVSHPEWSTQYMGSPTLVTLKTKGGKEFTKQREYPIGSTREPLTLKEVQNLYSKFTKNILSNEQIEKTSEVLLNLEKLNDVEEFMNLLTFKRRMWD